MADQEIVWELIGAKVPAGDSVSLDGGVVSGHLETPHITQVALGANPKPGRHTVFIEANDTKVAIGTLEKDRCEQFQVDFVANDMVFSHTGKSDVYLSGYNSISAFDVESDEEDYEDEEDEDDEDAPAAVPLQQQKLMSSKAAKAKQKALLNEEAGIASLKAVLSGAPVNGKDFSDMDDDDEQSGLGSEEDDEDDDEEDEEAEAEANALAQAMAASGDSDDDDDEEEEEAAAQVPPVVKGKRGAATAMTPQVLKKAKLAEAKGPASAPAKAPSQAPAGAAEAQYEQELKAFIKQSGGEVGMSILGSVKKPESFPKNTRLKAFLQAHSNSFAVAGDKVSLK